MIYKVNLNSKKRVQILLILQYYYAKSSIELNFSSDFELLIAAILSAKSTDKIVNRVTNKLFLVANTPEKFLRLGITRLKFYIKEIGLFNSKALNIMKTCSIILYKYKNIIPNNRKDLEYLPGVGRKISNLILNIIFNHLTIPVDTHVFRVCNRTRFATGKTVLIIEKKLLRWIPKKFKKFVHFWFVTHGRYICKARKIHCNICCINHLCEFNNKSFKK